MLRVERVRGLPHDGGIGLAADGTPHDGIDVLYVGRAAFYRLEALQLVACVGTELHRIGAIGIDAQSLEASVNAESQPVIAGEVGVDPPLADGLLRGGDPGVIRVAQRQAMTVEIEGDEAEPGLLRRLLGMTKGLVKQARVAPASPGQTSAGGANAPHFL